jgi:GntR family transcriptional regulator
MAGPLVAVDPKHPTPIYVQLDQGIRAAIATGRLSVGDQLPTVRQLAVDLRLNANTVARVYGELERAGVVETRRGVGTFVAARQPAPAAKRGREPELRALAERWAAEAAARGFSTDDVMREVARIRDKRGG